MPVNGSVIPHTPLAVDFWHVRKCPGTRLFFLSHMHSDHTVGLTSTWSDRPIYCSPVTGTLLHLKLQVKEQWIHPLEVGDPHLLPLDDIGKERLSVTLMDANHCPGSVMFLFQGYFGSILYTGDFRYSPSMLREPCLRNNITIDVLYLDNTNCDPTRSLPSRQRATQQIKEIIRSHPNHNVVIGLYTLGKESLLVELAMEFKTWIEVSFERMETIKALELPDVFTTDPGAGLIRVTEQSAICSASLHQWNKQQPTLALLPTSRPLVSFHPNVHVVPYSDHSSYQELEDFVSALKPSSLVPIVGKCVPGSISTLVPNTRRHEVLVPESVRHYMSGQSESQPSSSAAHASIHRRLTLRALPPKGVVFESPVRPSRKSCEKEAWEEECVERDGDSEEDMDSESSQKDSDCILIDLSKDLTPTKRHTRAAGDMWSLDIVKTLSEEMAYTKALKPVTATTRPIEMSETALSENDSTSQHSGHGNAQNDNTLSEGDGVRQRHDGIDREHDVMSNDNRLSQHNRHGIHQADRLTFLPRSFANESLSPCGIFPEPENIEDLENIILKSVPFTDEDLKAGRLLKKSFVEQFPLSPQYGPKSVTS